MDTRAQELLDGAEGIEAGMIGYLEGNAHRLKTRIFIYEKPKGLFDRGRRRFYLNQNAEVEEEVSMDPMQLAGPYTKIGDWSIHNFAKEYKLKALKQAVRALGQELGNQEPLLPFRD